MIFNIRKMISGKRQRKKTAKAVELDCQMPDKLKKEGKYNNYISNFYPIYNEHFSHFL